MSGNYTVRRVTLDDLNAIESLINEPNAKWFGNKRPKYEARKTLFKNYQTHRLVVVHNNPQETGLIAYAEFRNYPAIGPLPSDSWLEWLYQRYCITISISWLNTLFFNFCIYRNEHPEALLVILREVFYIENRIVYLITVKTPVVQDHLPYIECFEELEKYAKVYYPREFSIGSNTNTQSIYITERYRILPKITYRKALAEDNDDIIEIHANELPEMQAELGDFYIAEELMRQDENAKNTVLIVAEIENERQEILTAGFMWLTTDVDIRFYVKNYDLEIFGNLMKFSSITPHTHYEHICVLSAEHKAEANLFTVDAMDDLDAATIIGGVQRNDSGISVASASKFKVSSIHGTIVEANISSSQDKFYMREFLYLKFQYIFDRLITIDYYVNEQNKSINLFYNKDKSSTDTDDLQKASNVFALRYVCAHKDFPIERLYNFLGAMFSVFPDRDYCIMTIPKSVNSLRSHDEALKYFMPVAMRPSDVSNLDEIYITHRSTIFGEISLHRLQSEDVEVVSSLAWDRKRLSYLPEGSTNSSFSFASKVNAFADNENEVRVINDIMSDVLNNECSDFDVFTIRCGDSTKSAKENTTVGYVILRSFLHHHELHHHYHLPKYDDHLNNKRAEIISLRLHPLFNNSSDLVFRNLAGKTNYFDFYFICTRNFSLFTNDLKTMMMLIEPNVRKKYPFESMPTISKPTRAIKGLPIHDYQRDHLIVFRNKLNPSKWFGTSNRLIILGFTPVCKAFLRQLIFLWNSKDHKNSESYTCLPRLQVTVIASPGTVEAEYDCMFRCPHCENSKSCYMTYQNHSCYIRDVTVRMDLRYWVHFVTGRVNYIDRQNKYVKVNQSCEVFYDTLLLMHSRDYNLRRSSLDEKGRLPANFLEINDRIDKFKLFYKLRVLLEEHKRHHLILIYGSNLNTYECIAFLISHGVSPARVVLVVPHCKLGTEEEQKFQKPHIDKNVQFVLEDMLEDLEVEIHSGLIFSHWVQHNSANFIIEVVFTPLTYNKETRFDCDLFISFEEGHMNERTKTWLTKSGIELDGYSILVDKNFRTNDPEIYAVGKFIKIKEQVNHQYQYTSDRETASKLMKILELSTDDKPFEYKYAQPSYFQAILPLNYYITRVTMPSRYLVSQFIGCKSCSLTTYRNQTFCRIGLTRKLIVDEIVIVTKKDTPFDYLEHFCGKHETMLNNLRSRYKAGNIKCLMNFLQEPWTELLMHKDFEDLQAENHKALKPMIQTLDIYKTYSEKNFQELNQHILEQNVLNFIRKRRQDFQHEFALPEDFSDKTVRDSIRPKNCK